MESSRWEQIQAVFHAVADLSESNRAAAIEAACGDDSELKADVTRLLEEDAMGTPFFDRQLDDLAHQALDPRFAYGQFEELGPYQVTGFLGEGGMGVVYLARRKDLGSLVAIKLLRDAWLSPARRERFAEEQKTLAQLNHPGIARLYDAGILKDGTPWFVMEYVKGLPITEHCRIHKCSIDARLQHFRSVCEAVQYAHGQAIIHRDLKPSNIFLREDGTAKLLDFGIAKHIAETELIGQTRTLLRVMTPGYAAPEQIRGERVGTYTDVYSLGVILYELITGRLPFDVARSTPAEMENLVIHTEPLKPSLAVRRPGQQPSFETRAIGRTGWNDLDVLCLTAMRKDPSRRYQSAEALIRDIDHFLKDEPLTARTDSMGYRTGKFIRRNRRSIFAASFMLATVVGLVVFFLVRLTHARNAAEAEAARTQRVEQFMRNLFEGDHDAGPAENLRVTELLERGDREARTLNKDQKVQAALYETLGGIYEKLGKFDKADPLLQAALDQQRSVSGPDSAEAAEDLVALGSLRSDQGNHKEAEKLIREALAIYAAHPPHDPSALATATTALGQELEDAGSYDQAVKVLEQAVSLNSGPGGDQLELARSLTCLAETNFLLGKYAVAEPLHQRAMAIESQVYGDRHPLVANTLLDLGNIQQQWGHYAGAEQYFRKALEIVEAWYGHDNPAVASDMTTLAQTLAFEGHFDEAENLLRQALSIQESVYGKVHAHVAFVLNTMGIVAFQRGDLKEAESDWGRVVKIYRSFYGDENMHVALAMTNVGSVYLQEKDYGRAEIFFRDALRRYTKVLSADDLNIGIARIKLGRALVRQRRYREAEVETGAGLEILAKQSSPSVSWARAARSDLAIIYQALGEKEREQKVRAELAALQK